MKDKYTYISLALFFVIFMIHVLSGLFEDKIVVMKAGVKAGFEYAYFEGQRDVLNDDVRIEWKDSIWVWIKSPWDGDTSKVHIDLSKFKRK